MKQLAIFIDKRGSRVPVQLYAQRDGHFVEFDPRDFDAVGEYVGVIIAPEEPPVQRWEGQPYQDH